MNVLVLSTWFPFPADNGSRLRAFHLIRVLAGRGHRIRLVAGLQSDVASPTASADAGPLETLCDTIVSVPWQWHDGERGGTLAAARGLLSPVPRSVTETFTPALRDAVLKQCAVQPPDCLLVLEPGMDAYVPGATVFSGPRMIDNVEMSGALDESGTRRDPRTRLRQDKARSYWRRRLADYDAVTAVSAAEVVVLRGLLGETDGAAAVHLLPNGVETDAYRPAQRRPVAGRLLYNGSLTYGPNREAVLWFSRHVLPQIAARIPEAHLVVTGRYDASDPEVEALLGDASQGRIELTGFLPDMQRVLTSAALCVVPLLAGGGTRLKILEAWAAGIPVVSTPVGAAGLEAVDGVHLALAPPEPDAFADRVAGLLADPARADAIAASARRLAVDRYDWAGLGARLEEILADCVGRSHRGQATGRVPVGAAARP
jgi:hypothetical protein